MRALPTTLPIFARVAAHTARCPWDYPRMIKKTFPTAVSDYLVPISQDGRLYCFPRKQQIHGCAGQQ